MATAQRKKVTRHRGASRGKKQSSPPFLWFLAGLLIGLGVSAFLFFRGYLPERPGQQPVANTEQPPAETALIDDTDGIAGESTDRRFDFFTVLPEMEVVVPDQQLSRDALPSDSPSDTGVSSLYILQAGSFKSASDAEQMKARLALLGSVATIQVVTVNDATWHRVRIGPVEGARRADELRKLLQDNNIDTLVMKDSS